MLGTGAAGRGTPSVLALTRQGLPTLRTVHSDENVCARGAYILSEPDERAAGNAARLRIGSVDRRRSPGDAEKAGIAAAVVSMPCWELFERQPDDYRAAVLGDAPRIACEAASGFGWTRWIGGRGGFVGMQGFGASAPATQLYEHFGITAAAVAGAARNLVAARG